MANDKDAGGKAPSKVMEDPEFEDRFGYKHHPNFEKGGEAPKHKNAVYHGPDGRSWPAKVVPLPVNKGDLIKIPSVDNPDDEYRRIRALAPAMQAAAMKELSERMEKGAVALVIHGKTVRLAEYRGLLMKAYQRQVGDGPSARMHWVPCSDLLVNFGTSPKKPRWITISSATPKENVPTPAAGQQPIAHFELV